ncbi:hypothetical protein F4814DRAFT_419984 [Daldinia grandis]|nr:hypothetical protein F4814DRAFT_419984 [Daldinia grandis]
MDSYIRVIVDLGDEQHLNYDLTKLNNSSKFFSMLPREVRLMVYEYAVYVDYGIKPRQLARGSNRFSWFSWDGSMANNLIRYKGLTVVSLARACRTIYAELEHFQPFYKVNQFSFVQLSELRKYLAAITPSRRQAICRISYTLDASAGVIDGWLYKKRVLWDHDEYPIDRGTLTILSQTGLKEFTLVIDLSDSWERSSSDIDVGEMCYYLQKALLYPDELHTIWNLPFFRLGFFLNLPDEATDELIKEIDEALEARRRRIGPENPEWFKQLNNLGPAEKALCEVSDLDILGEDRVGLDRAGSYLGAVSSRTRGKCRAPNSMGQILKSVPRYSVDGILTSSIQGMYDIRWDGADAQCQVSHKYGDMIWEDVSAILIPDNVFFIISFYNVMMGDKDLSRLDEVKSKPTLRDILEIQGGFDFLQHTGAESYRKESLSFMREYWLSSADRWDAYIVDLERMETLEEQGDEATQEAKGRTGGRG